ncbi:MAG: RidA family protein [Saprospiraceae bacterium]|nr:RidA family protein [Saprospiraceae bacterium]
MPKQYINPPELFNSTQHGFSQVVVSKPGRLVFISGQVAWDENKQIVHISDMEIQARKAFENVQIAIEKAGGTLKDIVMLRLYIVHYDEVKGQAVGAVLREFFGTETHPASTWISVEGLASPEFLIESEAQAVINE